jgi:hypothetical protein
MAAEVSDHTVVPFGILIELRGRRPYYQRMTIDSLPDAALLEIFNFYVDDPDLNKYAFKVCFDVWHTLVHVCRRWRNVVFSSPRRLELELLCTYGRPVTEMVNIWPELPIIVAESGQPTVDGVENLIAALELNHRVSEISLSVWDIPYPDAGAISCADTIGHLVGQIESAPRLRNLSLYGIPFLALPRLLLSWSVLQGDSSTISDQRHLCTTTRTT